MSELDLGWCQGYMGLQFHMEEAYKEYNLDISKATCRPEIALFSKKYYNEINELDHVKKHDFCFIGSMSSDRDRRRWVIEFAKKYFTKDSVFIDVDNSESWEVLGEFDYTKEALGYSLKNDSNYTPDHRAQFRNVNENIFYFQTMCQSKYVLCPGGDAPWSFRFYEALMCKSIPIVETWHHTYRTEEESKIPYNYVLKDSIQYHDENLNDNMLKQNTQLFETYHMLQLTQKISLK